jgi:hypothetical protein
MDPYLWLTLYHPRISLIDTDDQATEYEDDDEEINIFSNEVRKKKKKPTKLERILKI